MKKAFFGILIVAMGIVFMGCSSSGGDSSSPGSSNAELLSLSVNEGTLTPAFSKNILAYTVSVPSTVDSIAVTGIVSDVSANLVVTPAQPTVLITGSNVIAVKVTAGDGTTTKTYTVTVTRASDPTDANLLSLSVNAGTLTPAFSKNTLAYTVSVPSTVDSITVTGIGSDLSASVAVTPAQPSALITGPNVIAVQVTAGDGTTTKTYTVTVTRAESIGNAGFLIKSPPSESKLIAKQIGSTWRLAYGLGPSLPYNVWTPWEIATTTPVWMSFVAEAGLTYTINWDDTYLGSGNYSGDLKVGAYLADKTTRVTGWSSDIDSGYSVNKTLYVNERQLIFLKIIPYGSAASYLGSFAVKVTQASSVNTGMSFAWYLDGTVIAGASTYLYTLDTAALTAGAHEVVSVGSRDGVAFSENFEVTK